MKKTKAISLGAYSAIAGAVAGCGGEEVKRVGVDPCQPATFVAAACQTAISNHGYHYGGAFFPMFYPSPYMGYFGGYNTYVARGGQIYSPNQSLYGRSYTPTSVRREQLAGRLDSRAERLGRSYSTRTGSIRTNGIVGGRASAVARGGFGNIGSGRGAGA